MQTIMVALVLMHIAASVCSSAAQRTEGARGRSQGATTVLIPQAARSHVDAIVGLVESSVAACRPPRDGANCIERLVMQAFALLRRATPDRCFFVLRFGGQDEFMPARASERLDAMHPFLPFFIPAKPRQTWRH